MSHIIAIASGKGGVGKTLLTATLAVALARRNRSVLAVDADMGLRNLDLLFGSQDDVLFDIFDVMKKRCKASEAIIPLEEGIDFLAASQKRRGKKWIRVPFSIRWKSFQATTIIRLSIARPGGINPLNTRLP